MFKLREVHSQKSHRDVSLDLIRIIAIIMVLIVHSREFFFTSISDPLILMVLRLVGTIGVPLFVILTGFLMTDRNYQDNSYLKNYIQTNFLHLLIAFEVWNILWLLLDRIQWIQYPGGGFPLTIERVLKAALFMGDTGTAMWYMPMILAVYLGIPVTSIAFQKLLTTKSIYSIILVIAIVYFGTIIPSLSDISNAFGWNLKIHSVINVNIFGASVWGNSVWILYILIGYLIKHGAFDRISSKTILVFGCILPTTVYEVFEWRTIIHNTASIRNYACIFVVIIATGLFILVKRCKTHLTKCPKQITHFISTMSRYSFSLYMIHLFVIGFFVRLLTNNHAFPIGDSFSGMIHLLLYLLFLGLVIIVSLSCTWIVSRIPILKKMAFAYQLIN